jgi:hypothetical protein
MSFVLAVTLSLAAAGLQEPAKTPRIELVRVPDGGLQPRAEVGEDGTLHLVYFTGDAAAGDLRYVRSRDGGKSFEAPIEVNHRKASAVAIGNVRGAQIALGRNGRVHVVWNGLGAKSKDGKTREPDPLLYTRLDDSGKTFELERDVISKHHGLDGGSAVAAHGDFVYVLWHAPGSEGEGEDARVVYSAASRNGGEDFVQLGLTFAGTGVCPCCGMSAMFSNSGWLGALYRTAHDGDGRDTMLMEFGLDVSSLAFRLLDPWKVPT